MPTRNVKGCFFADTIVAYNASAIKEEDKLSILAEAHNTISNAIICGVVVSRFILVEHNLLALLPGGDKVYGRGASHDLRRSKINVINVIIIHMLIISPHCQTQSHVDDPIPPS